MPGWGVSVSEVSECHSGAHKILDTQADHCPHNNSDSLLLTATSSKQTNNYTTGGAGGGGEDTLLDMPCLLFTEFQIIYILM